MMKQTKKSIIKLIPDFLDYLEIEKGLSSKTQENYSRYLKRFSDWLFEMEKHALLPHQLTPELIWKYRVFLARKTESQKTGEALQKNTQNYYLIAIRALLNFFTDRDITSLPAEKIKLAKQPKTRKIHFLQLEQIKALVEAPITEDESGLRDRAILEGLFSTGMRVSELAGLNIEQMKTTHEFLELGIKGKGAKVRTVYFSARALSWVKKYLQKRKDIDPALFINYKPGAENVESRRLSVRSIENIVKKYSKQAGLPIMTTPHTLRHSYATDLLNNGVDLRSVQEFLGHSDISTTQIYTHVTNKKLKDIYLKHHGGKNI
jgi:site-specific recombinase XerD